jgi:cell division protein FtsQ
VRPLIARRGDAPPPIAGHGGRGAGAWPQAGAGAGAPGGPRGPFDGPPADPAAEAPPARTFADWQGARFDKPAQQAPSQGWTIHATTGLSRLARLFARKPAGFVSPSAPTSQVRKWAPRDPAPSRWSYRWHRLWLTPAFRGFVLLGLPVLLVAALTATLLNDQARRSAITGVWDDIAAAFRSRPEFMVQLMSVEGASPVLADSVRRALDIRLPRSSFEIDLAAARAVIESFDAVQRADLRILPGGILQVEIIERQPAVLWRDGPETLWMLDATGHRIARLTARGLRADLPLIAGAGAERAVPEAMALLDAAEPIAARVRGLVRMGERRWDLVLDRDQRVLLPSEDPVRALEAMLALNAAQGLLARDLLGVDLRQPGRTIVRLAPGAADRLRNLSQSSTTGARL